MKTIFFLSRKIRYFFIFLLFSLALSSSSFAHEIRSVETEIREDFVLSPAKVEEDMDPGETHTVSLTVTNRQSRAMNFTVEEEDFTGSNDPAKAVVLLGEEKSPYTLKDFLIPEETSFTLQPKQEITLPVRIAIPPDAEPGGRYGAVLISSQPSLRGGGAVAISRLGALFFVRVNGAAKEEGMLSGFQLKNTGGKRNGNVFWYREKTFPFEIFYKNTGNVHLVPYGIVKIHNIFGTPVGAVEVEPYFALPDSTRYREIIWNSEGNLLGRYTAELSLNRGYGDKVDIKSISFWVVPWKILVGGFAGILLLLFFCFWFAGKFEIEIKKR